MGSSGTGHFTDYPGTPSTKTSGGGHAGGSSGADRCDLAISTILEDFERCDYWIAHKTAPAVGLEFEVLHKIRLEARTPKGECLGYIPTKYNYLAGCIASGRRYKGRIIGVKKGLINEIRVDIAPET